MKDIVTDSFEQLPKEVKSYILYLEQQLSLPVSYVSIGPGRDELLVR
jgi:adenylosuccinate synthase